MKELYIEGHYIFTDKKDMPVVKKDFLDDLGVFFDDYTYDEQKKAIKKAIDKHLKKIDDARQREKEKIKQS